MAGNDESVSPVGKFARLAGTVRTFAVNAARTPKTSIPGICSVLAGIAQIVHNPAAMIDPNAAAIPVGLLITGIGLLNSADNSK